ncbi:hypothetical protein T484DRAFT_1821337 [Baffinella frigidus]|nr:hypothetical protein T484DRAFT_1821337 [Cryptophyta sp. CCMP2293]
MTNSKTAIIANLSPADASFQETMSTLKFAQRAKLIKTRAIVNERAIKTRAIVNEGQFHPATVQEK